MTRPHINHQIREKLLRICEGGFRLPFSTWPERPVLSSDFSDAFSRVFTFLPRFFAQFSQFCAERAPEADNRQGIFAPGAGNFF